MSVYIYFVLGEAGGWGHWAVGDMGCCRVGMYVCCHGIFCAYVGSAYILS